jgi:TDG/mug DNA glycosylase family protein
MSGARGIETLPDLLQDGLDIVFVGINPSVYSARAGHYFARRSNRFWPCFSRSILSRGVRQALGETMLEPRHDRILLEHGFGFTDVAKRPTPKAADLPPAEFAAGVAALRAKLAHFRPHIACFHGITGYRHVHRALSDAGAARPSADPALGLQPIRLGVTRLFLVPNPSGANAGFSRADQVDWYDRLAACLAELPG